MPTIHARHTKNLVLTLKEMSFARSVFLPNLLKEVDLHAVGNITQ